MFRYYNARVTAEKSRRSSQAVRSRAAQLREHAIRAQLTAGFTACSVAETALALRQVHRWRDAVESARHIAQVVRVHLEEPNHVPAHSAAGLRHKLATLDKLIFNLEARRDRNCCNIPISLKTPTGYWL